MRIVYRQQEIYNDKPPDKNYSAIARNHEYIRP